MDMQWLTPKARVQSTPGKGSGSFAIESIQAGESVAGFGGFVVTRETLATMNVDRQSRSIQIAEDLYLAPGELPEDGDMLNHSCEPTCVLLGATVVIAWRDIEVGEELTFDYATADDTDYDEFDCFCESPSCRGKVTGNDWKRPELQQKYAGHFASYIQHQINLLG